MFSSGQFKMEPRTKPVVEEVEMEVDEPKQPEPRRVEPERRTRKRSYRESFDDDVGRYRGRYEQDDYTRRSRDRQVDEMTKEYHRMQSYSARQKLKKTAIKRHAQVMAKALGESENNVMLLSNYIKRFTQTRMNSIHFPFNS